jgi:hypothetical protein
MGGGGGSAIWYLRINHKAQIFLTQPSKIIVTEVMNSVHEGQ